MLTFLAATALASGPTWTVTVDPLTVMLGFAHVQVERRLGPRASLYIGPSLHVWDGLLTEDGRQPYLGLGADVGGRLFFTGDAPKGGWVMARGVLARLHTTDPVSEASLGTYGSVLVGYTGIIGDHFVLSGGAGISGFDYTVGEYGISGILPALHTNIGVAF